MPLANVDKTPAYLTNIYNIVSEIIDPPRKHLFGTVPVIVPVGNEEFAN
jgi:hypothetical protein